MQTISKNNFQKTIWDFYLKNKRIMPWRVTSNPYHILVSEVMLQQTQVARVVQKYPEFLKKFPNFATLAKASVENVLKVWSGMGYNRRALYLKKIAEIVIEKYSGVLPSEPSVLDDFPGIGYATAQSIATFAFNYPGVFIETNIRRVFIHFFFQGKRDIDDKEITPLVEKMLDKKNPREWYYALMDYGAHLPKVVANPNQKSKHYTVQSVFEGSDRQMRGKILKEIITYGQLNEKVLLSGEINKERVTRSLKGLMKEGFINEKKGVYTFKK